jgi:diaminopimelate epimerase
MIGLFFDFLRNFIEDQLNMLTGLPFTKFQSTGNDFILIDARDDAKHTVLDKLSRTQIAKICDRRFGVGADGLILLLPHSDYDFEMKNYNSDGGECTMCGNGARALVRFAHRLGIKKDHYRFIASDGEHVAKINNDLVEVKMRDVEIGSSTLHGPTFNTGSPHLICKVTGLMNYPVVDEGRKIRNLAIFMPSGINVNFIEEIKGQLFIRTYERGVEDETLSCGTGVIAAALATAGEETETEIQTRGGMLKVKFEKSGMGFKNIWLIGPAEPTFEGILYE